MTKARPAIPAYPVLAAILLAAPAFAATITYRNSDVPYLGPRVVVPKTPERQAILGQVGNGQRPAASATERADVRRIGFRQHDQGHTPAPNRPAFLDFAGRTLN